MLRWCTHDDHGRSLVSKLDDNRKWPQASDIKESCSAMHVVDVHSATTSSLSTSEYSPKNRCDRVLTHRQSTLGYGANLCLTLAEHATKSLIDEYYR